VLLPHFIVYRLADMSITAQPTGQGEVMLGCLFFHHIMVGVPCHQHFRVGGRHDGFDQLIKHLDHLDPSARPVWLAHMHAARGKRGVFAIRLTF
jgi:hypothetical protein